MSILIWAALGVLSAWIVVVLLARGTVRLTRSGRVDTFLLGAGLRVAGVTGACLLAFLSGPENGLGFVGGLVIARFGFVRFTPLPTER